jgi:tRNA pseudouridine13 synthase
LIPIDLEVKTLSSDSIELRFVLPKGTFATAVLRELVNYVDVNKSALANKEE